MKKKLFMNFGKKKVDQCMGLYFTLKLHVFFAHIEWIYKS
jgi:hypothetical protein